MTFEWVVLISILASLLTIVYLKKPVAIDREVDERINELHSRIDGFESTQELVKKLADETKKLISQKNLEASLRMHR